MSLLSTQSAEPIIEIW